MITNAPFDLDDLRLVQRVAATGSLSEAARALGLTPAAASRRLGVLEARIGQRLFARTTRRLRMTAEGEAFLPHADRVLAAAAEAEAALAGEGAAVAGTLRLTAPATFGRKVLSPMLARLLAAHPALALDLVLTDSVLDLVATGRDAAVRIAPLQGQSLMARRLAANRRLLCAAPSYLARRGVPESRAALPGHEALLLQGVDGWALVPPGGGVVERVRPAPRMVSNSNEALREACLAGLGIGLHSTWDVGEHLRRGELVALPETLGVPETLGIWLVFPGGGQPPARVRALAAALAREFGPVPPWER